MVIYNYADVLNVVHPVFAQESRSKLLLSDLVGICRSNVTITFVSDSNMPQSARQPTIPWGRYESWEVISCPCALVLMLVTFRILERWTDNLPLHHHNFCL